MSKLSDTNVVAIAKKKFNCSDEEAWSFVDEVIAEDKKEKELTESEPKEKANKEFMVVYADPKAAMYEENANCCHSGFIIQKLPAINSEGDLVGWGDLDISERLDKLTEYAREKHRKKGPFECIADLLQYVPAKTLKEFGLKVVSKEPASIVASHPEKLYSNAEEETVINDKVSVISKK